MYIYQKIQRESFLLSDEIFVILVPVANTYAEEAKGGDSHDLQWLWIPSYVMANRQQARKNNQLINYEKFGSKEKLFKLEM